MGVGYDLLSFNMKYLTIFLSLLIFFGSPATAEDDVLVKCTLSNGVIRHYLIVPRLNEIEQVDYANGQTCNLTITDQQYYWACDKTETTWASMGRVFRYTGKFETEWGEPPFGEFSDKNLYFRGTCERLKAEQKF